MSGIGRALYNVGFWVRETGQALDRLGCRLQGKYAFTEELSRHRTIMNLFDKLPEVPANAFVAPSAAVIGDVQIGQRSSVWYNAILRGDVNSIRVGADTNIQDGCIVHVAKTNLAGKILPTIIGSRVTVGHNAVLHACTVEDEAFVGIGATLLDGVVVESGAMVAAGALVVQNTRIPAGQIWAGSPAKFFRTLTAAERAFIAKSAESYASLAEVHAKENAKSFEEVEADKKQREGWANYSEDFVSSVGAVVDKPPVPSPAEESALLKPREIPGEKDAEAKTDREESGAVENKGAVVLSNIDKSAIDAGMGKLEEGRQQCLLEEKGKMTWEQQWMVTAVDAVMGRLVHAEEEEMARLLVAQQRQLKANSAVARAGEAALDARQAHGNLEEARRQAVVDLEASQTALEEARMRLGDLKTARQQHEEFLEKRIAQQKLVVERALKQLQDEARRIAKEESEVDAIGEGVTKLNSIWIQLAAEQQKLDELFFTC
ncbi:unnamed protein product [Closterium sp. NIES-65]|nr:unnamed protein product [Closterium sp. NIES-65]